MKFLLVFFALSIVNVVFSTIRTLVTVKGTKLEASLISGGYFAFYNVMLIYTVADFPLWQKCLITFACNVIGVFIVKWLEEKAKKDKLWKIEVTIPIKFEESILKELPTVSHSMIKIDDNHLLLNFYCKTQNESKCVKEIVNKYNGKYFASECKML